MTASTGILYEDPTVVCDGTGLTIRRYYPWGSKRIPYSSMAGVAEMPLSGRNAVRRWRIWGSGDFVHWWGLDRRRPDKRLALVLDVGGHVMPTITPDDPQAVAEIIRAHS